MNGTRFNLHIYGWLCVCLAIIFYSHFRSDTALGQFFSLLQVAEVHALQLPLLIDHHLSSFLQTSFMGYVIFFLVKPSPRQPMYVAMLAFMSASALECLQITTVLPGTFDYLDLLAVFIASIIVFLVLPKPSSHHADTYYWQEKPLFLSLFLGACLVSLGCAADGSYECSPDSDDCVKPITLTWAALRADIEPTYGDGTALTRPGKVAAKDDYLFIIDQYRGIHIFDTSNALQPQRIAFVPILGALTFSILGDQIYVNSFTDLVVINYPSLIDRSFEQTDITRLEYAFKTPRLYDSLPKNYSLLDYKQYNDYFTTYDNGQSSRPKTGFIIGYIDTNGDNVLYGESDEYLANLSSAYSYNYNTKPRSIADFVIKDGHLITVETKSVNIFDLENPVQPILKTSYYTSDSFILHSTYIYENNQMLIFSNAGALLFDLATPGILTEMAFIEDITDCDDIDIRGNYMYLIQKGGTHCWRSSDDPDNNTVFVFDISDITKPVLVKEIPFEQPYQLAIKDSTLFICYEQGLLEWDISDPLNPIQIDDHPLPCADINTTTNPIILTNNDGVYLAQHNNPGLTLQATIATGQ